jgi:hypothetical protein
MKRAVLLALIPALAIALCSARGSAAPPSATGTPTRSDEFNGTQVDPRLWNVYGSNGVTGWGGAGPAHKEFMPSNVRVSGGYLQLTAQADASGGRIDTDKKFSSGYGTYVVRMKFDLSQPVHASYWWLGENGKPWPAQGEVDVVEETAAMQNVFNARTWMPRRSEPMMHCYGGPKVSMNMSGWKVVTTVWHKGSISIKVLDETSGKTTTIMNNTAREAAAKHCIWPFDNKGYKVDQIFAVAKDGFGGGRRGGPVTELVDYWRYYASNS